MSSNESDSEEVTNLSTSQPDVRPAPFSRSLIAHCNKPQHYSVLPRVVDVWKVVSSWGRWTDESLGPWPETSDCINSLPSWFRESISNDPTFYIESWLDDLHDRDWIWWSGYDGGEWIKVDLRIYSFPASTWAIEYLIHRASAELIYKSDWLSIDDALAEFRKRVTN